MIGVVVRELTFLKVLHPIMEELRRASAPYTLYHFDAPRGDKEYNRATLNAIKKSSPTVVKHASQIKPFSSDVQLKKQLLQDKVKKLVSLEVYLWAKSYISELKSRGMKIYNILYLTDSLWNPDKKNITSCDRVYYSSKYLMETHLDMLGLKLNPSRDRWIGSPVYDSISIGEHSNGLLVMLPNLRAEHVQSAFGSKDKFIKIMDNVCRKNKNNLVFKTRKKQWMPKELTKYGAHIIDDGDKMYPPAMSQALSNCSSVLMFYSSGIYECVYAGKHVINIPLNLGRWGHDKKKMKSYFQSSLYDFPKAVINLSQDEASSDSFFLELPHRPNGHAQEDWLARYMGITPLNSSRAIVEDILSD